MSNDAAPIDGTEFSSLPRELRPREAVAVTRLGLAANQYRLSTGDDVPGGDDRQASHWKDDVLTGTDPIGIMDLTTGFVIARNNTYMQSSDIDAFDVMGYIIDRSASVSPPPQPAEDVTPADQSTVPAGAITISWSAATGSETYEILVDCTTCIQTYYEQGITSTSHVVPSGIFGPGDNATIFVISRNWRGFAVASTQISVAGVTCDSIDFNNENSLFDQQDIDAFLSVFSEGPCIPATATCNDIDFNNDTSAFDICDVQSFLLVFSEGPCTPCGP